MEQLVLDLLCLKQTFVPRASSSLAVHKIQSQSQVPLPELFKMSTITTRGLRCYPLRVAFLRISGLWESLDCPSDWFVGVAEEGAMPKNQ